MDALQEVFKETRVPVQLITTEDRATVAIVFERVNQKGVELDTLQLLSAWTWSEDFDLQRKFDELAGELEPFGFGDVAQDKNLLLRCFSAVLLRTVNTNDLIKLNGSDVRSRFTEIVNGIKGAIDFLRMNLNVYSLSNLPSPNTIIPLTVFFATAGNTQVRYSATQRNEILKWFWRVSFMRRYNSQTVASLQEDIDQMVNLKNSKPSTLGEFTYGINSDFFSYQEFRINTIASKAMILMLAQKNPRSLISGAIIDLGKVLKEYNRNEFHHIFPQAHLKSSQNKYGQNCLANLCFLSRTDNNQISAKPPKEYGGMIARDRDDVLSRSLIPDGFDSMSYDDFIDIRANLLREEAMKLMDRGY